MREQTPLHNVRGCLVECGKNRCLKEKDMLYDKKEEERTLTPEEEFVNLLRQVRPDKARKFLCVNKVADTVFELPEVKELVKNAVLLAVRLGNPEDARTFQRAFRAPESIWNDPLILQGLRKRLQYWEEIGHSRAKELRALYPVLCKTPVTPRRVHHSLK
jgi:hypothetical protein